MGGRRGRGFAIWGQSMGLMMADDDDGYLSEVALNDHGRLILETGGRGRAPWGRREVRYAAPIFLEK